MSLLVLSKLQPKSNVEYDGFKQLLVMSHHINFLSVDLNTFNCVFQLSCAAVYIALGMRTVFSLMTLSSSLLDLKYNNRNATVRKLIWSN